jgi:alpha-N-arabinofuranosidase
VNVIAPIFTNQEGLYLQTIYFPLVEYGKQRGNLSLDVLVSCPTYRVGRRPAIGYLDVSSTYDKNENVVYLNVLNRSENLDIATEIENVAGRIGANVDIWEMNHPDLKATHTFGDDQKVRPVSKSISPTVADGRFSCTFPKHSLTILRYEIGASP